MESWKPLILCLFCFVGCSDLGTGSDLSWVQYDLPYGHISLPSELARVQSKAAIPENPEFVGVVDGYTVQVQFCVYDLPHNWQSKSYEEQATTLQGRKAVMFRCFGVFHLYDSHFSTMIGMKAHFGPDGNPVVVVAAIHSPESEDLVRAILMTMRP